MRLDDLAELAADGTLILRYDGDGAPPMKQPPPKQPPPVSVAAVSDGSAVSTISVRIDASDLVPGCALRLAGVEDLDGLARQIGAALGLDGVEFVAWDEDFEEWCAPTNISELEGSSATRLKITSGSPTGTTSIEGAAAVVAVSAPPALAPGVALASTAAGTNRIDEGVPPTSSLRSLSGRSGSGNENRTGAPAPAAGVPPLTLAPGGSSHDGYDRSLELHRGKSEATVETSQEDRFAEVRVKKRLSEELRQYVASHVTEPPLVESDVYDAACFAWDGMLEDKPCAEIVKLWQRERTAAASIRMSLSMQLGMGTGFLGGAVDSLGAMSAPEVTRLASHSGWLAHEEKRKGAGFKRWTRKWIALVRSVGTTQHDEQSQLLLCYADSESPKPEGMLRLGRGSYTVAPPRQPRRNYPYCFRIDADTPNNREQSGKYLFAASTAEEVSEWIAQLQPQRYVARTRTEAKRELALVHERSGKAIAILRNSFMHNGVRKTLAATGATMLLPSALKHGWELRERKRASTAGHGWRRCYCVLWRLENSQPTDPFYLLFYADHAANNPDGWLSLSPGGYRVTSPSSTKENEHTLRVDTHTVEEGDSKLRMCFPTDAERAVWVETLHTLFHTSSGDMPSGGDIWGEATSRLEVS